MECLEPAENVGFAPFGVGILRDSVRFGRVVNVGRGVIFGRIPPFLER
jgi:hypothetical protein